MNQACSDMVIRLAQAAIAISNAENNNWETAYFRFSYSVTHNESTFSYRIANEGYFLRSLGNKIFNQMTDLSEDLMKIIGKPAGVFLLKIEKPLKYSIDFEWKNMQKWKISKFDGGSGIPSDL